jgi:hypothetical protein
VTATHDQWNLYSGHHVPQDQQNRHQCGSDVATFSFTVPQLILLLLTPLMLLHANSANNDSEVEV